MTGERIMFAGALLRRLPPWLQRTVGARVVQGMADPIDALVTASVEAVKARLPVDAPDATALGLIGAERRIRRGPGESAQTYARRIRTWWDAHRTRGGAYALLGQLDAYFQDWCNVRMDVVANSGLRRWIDAAATVAESVITRDSVTWDGDGSGRWARIWVFLYVPAVMSMTAFEITDDAGVPLTLSDGSTMTGAEGFTTASLTTAQREVFAAVPREWSAAHIDQTHVVLLSEDRRLWNYPQPVPTWAAWGATSTWDEPPTIITITS